MAWKEINQRRERSWSLDNFLNEQIPLELLWKEASMQSGLIDEVDGTVGDLESVSFGFFKKQNFKVILDLETLEKQLENFISQ